MPHYEERIEADVKAIRGLVSDQGAAVLRALHDAVHALLTLDLGLAARTILGDHPVNRRAQEIDRRCHAFVARHVPSAGHLRFVSAVMRMNIALERVGDYAVTICREVAQMRDPPPPSLADDIELMAQHGRTVLGQALAAFAEGSADLARGTLALARQQGRTFHKVFTDLLREGETPTRRIEDLFGLLVVLYRLERVGDQAKNLCEDTIFVATGAGKPPKVYSVLFVDRHNDRFGPMAQVIAQKAFPESGTWHTAGWDPAPEMDPVARAFLDRQGFALEGLAPRRLETGFDDLAEHHVIVGLEAGARAEVPHIPFHTVFLDWDVLRAERPPYDEAALERVQRALSHEIRGLMDLLRGEGAS